MWKIFGVIKKRIKHIAVNTCWRNKKSGTFQHFPEDSKRSLKNKKFKYIAVILYQNKCSSATVIDKFSVKLIVMSEIIRHTKKNVLKVIFMKKVFRKVFFFFLSISRFRCDVSVNKRIHRFRFYGKKKFGLKHHIQFIR